MSTENWEALSVSGLREALSKNIEDEATLNILQGMMINLISRLF